MGFDIVLYGSNNNTTIGFFEVQPQLHHALFSDNVYWKSHQFLRKLSDYYTTNVRLNQDELQQLIDELRQMKSYIEVQYHKALDQLIDILSDEAIITVHIAGD